MTVAQVDHAVSDIARRYTCQVGAGRYIKVAVYTNGARERARMGEQLPRSAKLPS